MLRSLLKSKIHRATVTAADLHYEGSLTIDADLMEAADLLPFEEIHVWDVTNGNRLVTYAMRGEPGSGVICVNGAGAHLIQPGDLVIIASFIQIEERQARTHRPKIVLVDEQNRSRRSKSEDGGSRIENS